MANLKLMHWAVCFDIDAREYDDRQPRTSIIAIFNYPFNAEDFITYCLPAENRDRFYIKYIEITEDNIERV